MPMTEIVFHCLGRHGNLLLMYCAHLQSNIKIPLVLTVSESSALEERERERKREQDGDDVPQTGIISSLRSFASALGYFSRPQAAAKRLPWGSDVMTSQRGGAKVDCCVIIFLEVQANLCLARFGLVFVFFFTPWKTAGLCLGRWTGVGRRSLGMKSTLPSTEVHVYLWPLLDVDVGRVREPLVQKKKYF